MLYSLSLKSGRYRISYNASHVVCLYVGAFYFNTSNINISPAFRLVGYIVNIENVADKQLELMNRELGLVSFYRRVLAKATEQSVPLLERLQYLCIVCQNCDELFEVRIARLLKWQKETPQLPLSDGLTADKALELIHDAVSALYHDIYNIYHIVLIPALHREHIDICTNDRWTPDVCAWAREYFIHELKPVLTPIGIDPVHPFPRIPNKNLHFAVALEGKDEFGRSSTMAIVEAPRILPRVIKLPAKLSEGSDTFILLQDIIKLHAHEFFSGLAVRGCYPFRVTRASDLVLSGNTNNIRSALAEEIIHSRKFAKCTRLEIDISDGMPESKFINTLAKQFGITAQYLYFADGPVNLSRLQDIANLVNRPELRFPKYIPGTPQELISQPDIFKAMDKSDILIHTPYQSFDPVLELTKRAANDPDVLAIKMTVYRTNQDSELVQNLIKAAIAGKHVVASVELFARFDEEVNVAFASQLENAGAHVVYGVMGYKVHAKMLLIVKRNGAHLKYYTHIGTGNYHQNTAKLYTDFSLLTTNQAISTDIDNIFAEITGIGHLREPTVVCHAPFLLHNMLMGKIQNEIAIAKTGGRAEIIAKMNALLEPQIIRALYAASSVGVKIRLIVRGACALLPGIQGLSENISVISVVGRFLEHNRIFYFYNSGAEDVFLSSADWMGRNFFKRVEACVPILDKKIKGRIIAEGLNIYLQDNVDAWRMESDGRYTPIHQVSKRKKHISAQQALILKLHG